MPRYLQRRTRSGKMKVQKRQTIYRAIGTQLSWRGIVFLFLLSIFISVVGIMFEFYYGICLPLVMILSLPILVVFRKVRRQGEWEYVEDSAIARAQIIELKKELNEFDSKSSSGSLIEMILFLILWVMSKFYRTYTYNVVFQFNAGGLPESGQEYLLEAVINKEFFERYRVGGTVKVRYLKANPRKVLLQDERGFRLGSYDETL